ncbi:MAG: 3-methyl-2-oxobutanoate dehydrogenase subunit VorB [Thermodesulfobacteriota bacterium]|nr:3-methyl-2-oxobutanoate dehydrogenase subunit VorB [Thermodesulfobacteriota bacterium]
MTEKIFIDGNEAVGRGAIMAGCKYFFGYPITPQNEIPEYFSRELPKVGGVYLQSEGETAAGFMLLGGALSGARCMTSTSSPGFSLMQEAISHMAASELPAVIVEVMRLGPGAGTTQQGQTDYRQVTKGGGHGAYRSIVLAPSSVQEVFDFVQEAFYLAEKYRILVIVLMDFILGRMSELIDHRPVNFDELPEKEWALKGKGRKGGRTTQILSGVLAIPPFFERQIEKYNTITNTLTRHETYCTDDAELLVVAYGSSARSSQDAVDMAREEGLKAGLLRPITLWPFPQKAVKEEGTKIGRILVVEDSPGELVEDVRASVGDGAQVDLLNILARHNPTPQGLIFPERILKEVKKLI